MMIQTGVQREVQLKLEKEDLQRVNNDLTHAIEGLKAKNVDFEKIISSNTKS